MKPLEQLIEKYISKGHEFKFMKRLKYAKTLKDVTEEEYNYVFDMYHEYLKDYKDKYVAKFYALLAYSELF